MALSQFVEMNYINGTWNSHNLFYNGIMDNGIIEAELSIEGTLICLSFIGDSKSRDHVGT